MALVGGGSTPKYSPNKVIIWDDNKTKSIAELKFKMPVKAVRMSREQIAVVLEDRIYIYQLLDLMMKDAIETAPNPDGISVLKNDILVCPDKEQGTVRINNFKQSIVNNIEAHEGPIRCLALNHDSTLLATASEKGTLIRIFNTSTGKKVKEVRRGADTAHVYSISFNP